jgi:hypothetical protein
MFGRGKESGQATIIARQTHEGGYRKGVNFYAPTGQYHHVYDYIADVTPDDGGTAFRATFVEMFESDTEYRPMTGDVAVVKIDPKTNAVKFDRNVLYQKAKAAQSGQHSAFEALSDAPVGTPKTPGV